MDMMQMVPLQFAQSPSMAQQLQGLTKQVQQNRPPQQPGVPTAGTPMNIAPAATNAGTNVPQPGLMDAIRGMSPQNILAQLRTMSAGPAPGLPGSVALDGAGMLTPPQNPLGPLY